MMPSFTNSLRFCLFLLATFLLSNQSFAQLSGWTYADAYEIDYTHGNDNVPNYQIKLSVNHSSMVLSGKSQSNADDIRFTMAGSTTLLPYWIESGLNTSNMVVWVKIPQLTMGVKQYMSLYYGNNAAAAYSDGDATFEFFEDFESSTLNTSKWSSPLGSRITLDDGKLKVDAEGCYITAVTLDFYSTGIALPSGVNYDMDVTFYARTYHPGTKAEIYFGSNLIEAGPQAWYWTWNVWAQQTKTYNISYGAGQAHQLRFRNHRPTYTSACIHSRSEFETIKIRRSSNAVPQVIALCSNFSSSASIANATCTNPLGSASISVQNGAGPYTYTWSSGQTTSSISNQPIGNYTYSVTDNLGCYLTGTANIGSTPDTENPNAICKPATVYLDAAGNGVLTIAEVDNGSNDNCGITNISLSQTHFDCNNLGTNVVVLTVTDNSGNASTCTATVTVEDNIPPTAICKNLTLTLDANGQASITAADIDNGSNDACGITLTSSQTVFDCSYTGANNVTLTATDYNGNVSTCVAVVTIEDNTNPTAVCNNLTIDLQNRNVYALTQADIDFIANGSNDNCTFTYAITSGQTSFDCDDKGQSYTITLTVTDASGNIATCNPIITITDNGSVCNDPPSAVCQNITISTGANCDASIVALDVDGGSTDPDGDVLTYTLDNYGPFGVGTHTVTLTVADAEYTDNCTATVTVEDNTDPVAICQGITVQLDANGDASIVPADVDNGSNDACGIASLSVSPNSFGCVNVGANTVTLTVTDNNGNTSTCTSTVTVEDNIPPTAICQPVTVQLDANGNRTITANNIDNGSNDACGIASLVASQTTFDCSHVRANTITLTVTDNNGNVSICTTTVTVEDNVDPIALCKTHTVQLDASGNGSMTAADIDNSSNDACGIASVVVSKTSFDCTNVGANTVTLTVTDNNGNVSTCTSTVTVEDNVDPIALCQPVTVQLDASGNGSITTADVDNGSNDACGIASVVASKTSFDCTNVGANTVTLTVTDNNGNVSICTTTVTVEDNVDPIALCQPITVQLDANGNGSITAADVNDGSNDACGILSLSLSKTDLTCTDIGANSVTLTVTDNNNNVSTCQTTITVEDNVNPIALCQPVTVQLDANGNGAITANDIDNGSSDACGIASLVASQTTFDCSHVGANTVMLTVTDNNGNISTCTSTVIVEDNVAPIALCQPVTVQLDASGNGSITAADVDNGSNDACGITSLSLDDYDFTCADVGTNTVTLTVTDNNGNVSTCTTTVTVEDNVDPVALCKIHTVQLDALGNGSMIAADIDNGSNDACGIASVVASKTSFDCTNVGANTVTLTVTDNNNNVSTCQATITVEDNVNPVALCKIHTVQLDASGNGSMTAANIDNSSNDACGIASVVASKTSFDCTNVGANTITLTVTDNNGNVSICTTTVTVEDNVDPIALCKTHTVQLDASGNGSMTAANIDNSSNDACGIASVVASKTSFDCTNVGANTVTLTVTDNNNNVSTCQATITVEDNVNPVALCKIHTVQLDASGNGSMTAVNIDNSSNDACGIASVVASKTSFDCTNVGANTITLTVTDNNGNVSICTTTVTVEDNVDPIALCKTHTVQLDASGNGSMTAANIDNSSNDACGIASVVASKTSFDCTNVGANTVMLTVTDNNGNVSICTTTVTVEDNVDPIALCKTHTVQLDASGNGSMTAANIDNSSNDACGIASVVASKTSFDCTNVGANTVMLTVTDNNGNVSTCTTTVTVEDNVDPIALCQPVIIQLDNNGKASITTADVDNGSKDACGIASLTLSKYDYDCTNLGSNTVTLTVTDKNGNVSTCTATITIEDNVNPVAICQAVTVQLDANGNGSITTADVDNGSNDACGIASLSLDDYNFTCADVGANTVTLTVTDNNNNVSTCQATITVEDNVDPITLCQPVTIQLDNNGETSITTADIDNGSNDACGISGLSLSKTDFDCSNLGTNTVTLAVTDNNGNTSTCTATVTVEDNINPVISGTPANINVIANRNDCDPQVSWTEPTASDNCYVTITSTHQPGDEFSVGTTTVTYTAVDQSNNSVTSSFTITVQPEPFVITSLSSPTFNGGWNISCYGLEDGSATVILEGGCYPYTYLWSDGQTSATATNLAADTYGITILDGNGTSTSGSITLTQPTELVITSLTNTNICANDLAAVPSAGYEYKMTIDIDPQMVSGSTDLTNFPVVLELQDNSFKCVNYGGKLFSENGDDIMVTNSSCDPLPYQVERYDPATGEITIWVQVDELSTSATTSLNIIYSNEYEAQSNDGSNVWDADYAAAWHMSDELHAGKLGFEDATANTNDVEKKGSTYSSHFIDNIAGAFDFGRSNYTGEIDKYDLDNSLRVEGEVFVQAWVKVDDARRCNKQIVIAKGKNSNWKYASYYLGVNRDYQGGGQYGIKLQGAIRTTNGSHRFETGNINENEWTLLGLGYDGTTIKAYINGQEVYSHAWSGTITDYYKDELYMGRKLDGGLDEARVSSVARADNWIGTEYNNQLDPSANITLGSETENGCGDVCAGTAQVAVEGGTPAYIYNWSNGDNTTDARGLCEGEHTITITDQNGCAVSNDVDVEINRDEFVELSFETENMTCNGESNGSIDLTIGGRQPNPDGKLNRDIWHNINGKYISNLTNSSRYPNTPDISTIVTTFEGPSNYGDQYGQRIYGWVKAPETGTYRFMVSGDERVELWVSPTENPQDKQRVAYSNRSTHHRHCHQYSSQRSAMIPLIGGNYYYVEVLHKEYRGSDHVTVGWELPSGGTELPIGSTHITTAIPQITVPAVQSITWSNDSESEDLSNLPAGTYEVYVVTQSGCVATDEVEITQPDVLEAVGDASNISCNGETDGSIDASATGGTAPYTYSWAIDGTELVESGDAHACVAKSSDDAEEKLSNGGVYTNGKTLDLGSSDSRCRPSDAQEVGVRFQNLSIPQGATITSAYVKFLAYGTSMSSTSLSIKGQLSDDAQTFTYRDGNVSARSNTNSSVAWNNIPNWSNGKWYQSPDVSSIVQELVNQNEWNNGNAMAFMIDGSGHRRAYSYDKWRYGAPVLHVTYESTNNSDQLDGLAAGAYSLVVTDANGCEDTETVTITEPAILAATATTEDVSCAGSGSSTCDLMAASGAGHAVWLPGLPGCASASFYWKSGKGSFEVLPNGKAHVTGTIYNKYDSRREWEIDVWLTDKNDWNAWSGMGRSWKGNSSKVGNNYKDWDYYIMDASQSNRLIGKDKYNGKTLYLNHKPSNYQYAWQVGKAANDKNTNFGMSAWFTYTGSYSGHGDFNFDSDCGTATAGSCDGQTIVTATGGTAPYSYDWSTGDNTASVGTLCEGTHELTVTDANGCEFIMDITIGAPQPILVSLTATSPTCYGNSDGAVSASVSGGTAPYTYQWNVTGTNSSISNLGAGMYMVTVVDAKGCSQTAEVQLDPPAAIQLTTSITEVSCNGGNDGSASVSIQGGKAPYTIEWSTTTTGPDAFNLSAGGYEVSVTDANGCTAGATAIVTQPDPVSVTATSPTYSNGYNLSSNGTADGKINLDVTGGTRPYTYDWTGSVETTDYLWKQVNNSYHDAEESYRGYMSLTSSDLELVYDGSNKNQKVGMLFSHIDLPQGAVIEEAYIQFTSEGTKNSSSIDLDIYGHDVNNSWSFSTQKRNISSRTLTTANVNWNPAKWTSKYKSAADQQTPDLSDIVQEIVDRSGWSTGNCMTFIVSGSGSREAYSYDGNHYRAPELIIKYRKAAQGKNPRDLAAGYYTVKVTDANGCVDSTNITLTEPNGGAAPIEVVKELTATANHIEVSVSPNPVKGMATVTINTDELEEPVEMMVRVTDMNGKTMETIYTGKALTGEQMQIQTSLNGLRSGIYQISVITSDGKQTSKRFVVAR